MEQILKEIQKLLIDDWDPIGIREIPEAYDEYDSYVLPVYKILMTYRSKNEIFDYLRHLETVHMGLVGDKLRTEKIVTQLLDLVTKDK